MTTKMPKLQTPREACAAALGVLLGGGGRLDAIAILDAASIPWTISGDRGAITASVRLSPRKRGEGTAGCSVDALAIALTEALGGDPCPQWDGTDEEPKP
jgi:hypothetical protein